MTPEEFDACFDEFHASAERLEMRPFYTVPSEQPRIQAFRDGLPRPVRSVRTDPWLRRIAVTTAAGKLWSRVRVIDDPPTEYQRYQIPGYVESQAAGDEILIVRRGRVTGLPERDFWLFDYHTDQAFVLFLDYDADGHFLGAQRSASTEDLAACHAAYDDAYHSAVPLNSYLAAHAESLRAA